jgi:hypothetical protein
MTKTSINRRTPALAVMLSLSVAPLALAACGGSSSGSSTGSTSTSGSATSASAQTAKGNTGRFAAMRACLQKNGITLPQRAPGSKRPRGAGAGGFLGGGGGGGPQLPKGVTRAQLQAAMAKCGGGAGGFGGARSNNPAFKASLAKFATCMSQNGVKLPAPSTSGGPVFNTKGINTHSKAFVAAETKCQSLLRGSFRRGGGGGPGGVNGAPGTDGGGAPPASGRVPGSGAPPAAGETQAQ